MTIETRIVSNDFAEEWDTIISQSPQGTLFHTWNWLKITEKHTDMKFFPVVGIKDNKPVGVFPLFFQKKGPVRLVFSPPPHAALPYLGPVLAATDILRQDKKENLYIDFMESVENFISEDLHAQYISISLSPALQDSRPFIWSGYTIVPNYDYSVDLSPGIDTLYKNLDYNKRSGIKKAKEKGMEVKNGTKKDYEAILDLLNIRYAEQGKHITTSRDYFLDIFDNYKDYLKIFMVTLDEVGVTGVICVQYRDTLYGWVGNPKPINRISPSPNHLLFWETIRYASEHGFRYYVSMSAAGDKRLHEYYAARFDPELRIRYAAIKSSVLTGMLEKGYTKALKPMIGTMKNIGILK